MKTTTLHLQEIFWFDGVKDHSNMTHGIRIVSSYIRYMFVEQWD
jgi:hypothetical protein